MTRPVPYKTALLMLLPALRSCALCTYFSYRKNPTVSSNTVLMLSHIYNTTSQLRVPLDLPSLLTSHEEGVGVKSAQTEEL
jgi:hypothetical protein